jgi:hypothetical protein
MTRDLADAVKSLATRIYGLMPSHPWAHDTDALIEEYSQAIEPAIRDLIEEEREECAKLLSEQKSPYHDWGGESFNSAMQYAAKLIRARGGKA